MVDPCMFIYAQSFHYRTSSLVSCPDKILPLLKVGPPKTERMCKMKWSSVSDFVTIVSLSTHYFLISQTCDVSSRFPSSARWQKTFYLLGAFKCFLAGQKACNVEVRACA